MIMFLGFVAISLFTTGIIYAVYGTKRKYNEGMLMGVHMPESAVHSGEVEDIMGRYHRNTNLFYILNMLLGAASCALCFWYMSVFIIIWCVWILELCIGAMILLCRTHRRLYDLKVRRGWIGSGGSRIMAADTKAAALSGRMGLSARWHILFGALIFLPCIDAGVRKWLCEPDSGWIFLITGILVCVMFGVLHAIVMRLRNKVYSEDSQINIRISRVQKNAWSYALVSGGLCNAAAYLVLASRAGMDDWISGGSMAVYITLQTLPGLFLIGGFFYIHFQKEKLLSEDERPLYIDDDVYWKNGWYSNPNDKRLMVQDWACSWNYTTNMARPAAKICMAATILIVAAGLIWLSVVMLRLDFTPIGLKTTQTHVEITSGDSDYEIAYEDIVDVRLIDQLPEEDYHRKRGTYDERRMMGQFRGKETGKCRMYLYVGYEPILEIVTEDGPVYVNSKTPGQTEKYLSEVTACLSVH